MQMVASPKSSPKMSVSRVQRSKLSTALSATTSDFSVDPTQSSHSFPTTSYVIKSERQKSNQTVAIYFAPIKQYPEMARTEMQLCNDADVPLLFKFRSDIASNVVAAPAGSGCIPPRAEQRCFLTWRRSANEQSWEDAKAPKLILITNFVEQDLDDSKTVMTKLLARMHEGETEDELPLMKFTFERKEEEPSQMPTSANNISTASSVKTHGFDVDQSNAINRFIQWCQRHPLETIMLILFFVALFFAFFS